MPTPRPMAGLSASPSPASRASENGSQMYPVANAAANVARPGAQAEARHRVEATAPSSAGATASGGRNSTLTPGNSQAVSVASRDHQSHTPALRPQNPARRANAVTASPTPSSAPAHTA